MGLSVEMPDGRCHRVQGFVGEIPQKTGALPQKFHHQTVETDLLLIHAGEVAPAQQFLCVRGELVNFAKHPAGVSGVCGDCAGGK